jgi:hypothetical protein
MEYPMIVFVRNLTTSRPLGGDRAELGHMWFPMMVGPTRRPRVDGRSVNTFITIFAASTTTGVDRTVGGPGRVQRRGRVGDSGPLALRAGRDRRRAGHGISATVTRDRPGAAVGSGRRDLRSSHEYTRRWLYKHPSPWDFFHTFEAVAGQDLDWFWVPWFYGPAISDMAIADVEVHSMAGKNHVVVAVRNDGTVISPVLLRITGTDGTQTTVEAPATRWFGGQREISVEGTVDGDIAKVELDPERLFADIDESDDVWTP